DGERRISIVIGLYEANSIFIGAQNRKMPRPITHDMVMEMTAAFGYSLRKMVIYDVQQDVYSSFLYFMKNNQYTEAQSVPLKEGEQQQEYVKIDARTSDALAMAVRCGCPIFVNEDILEAKNTIITRKEFLQKLSEAGDFVFYSDDELSNMLQEALQKDDFETAIKIREEKKRRNNK
ncbi:MAG: bifunctional nuclease family protein, partial [Bacteroidales bacterium]|nr:bifunctional nuclease family protein [Bacteroidales bacterium]